MHSFDALSTKGVQSLAVFPFIQASGFRYG